MLLRPLALGLLAAGATVAHESAPVDPEAETAKCSRKAAGINHACCEDAGVSCDGGSPATCTPECARMYAPFYSKCSQYLRGVPGLDLDAVLALCQGAGADGGVTTMAATVGGFINGGFDTEDEDICAYTCRDGHEWGPFAGTQCGHKYMEPVGWAASGTAVVCNTNSGPWGGLVSGPSANYLSIQGHGSFIEQTVEGLTPGETYEISFAATHRPTTGNVGSDGTNSDGEADASYERHFGEGEALRVLVDGEEVFHTNRPGAHGRAFHVDPSGTDQFQPFTAIFSIDQASPSHVTIRIENDSPEVSMAACTRPRSQGCFFTPMALYF